MVDLPIGAPAWSVRHANGQPYEVRWEIWAPKRWFGRWHGLVTYRSCPSPGPEGSPFGSPWMESLRVPGAWTRKRLERKLEADERGILQLDLRPIEIVAGSSCE